MAHKVLIIDDSESIRQAVSITLEMADYEVIIAKDGLEAKEFLNGDKIDLIITDLNMPNMDGIEIIKLVRSIYAYKFTPLLLLTTESQTERKIEAKAAGATGWIVKPFYPEKLIETIKKIIR